MNVILDTNIFTRDFSLASTPFRVLLDYVDKTNCLIALPTIVHKELCGVYRRKVTERLDQIKKDSDTLRRMLVSQVLPAFDIDIDEAVINYMLHVENTLGVKSGSDNPLVPYQQQYLDDIVEWAINRRKPCSNGEEFRDALLWKTVIDYAQRCDRRSIIFISDNIKEFAQNGELHPELVKDTTDAGVNVIYFQSLETFRSHHAVTIEFLNQEWLKESLDHDELEARSLGYIGVNAQARLAEWATKRHYDLAGAVDPSQINLALDSFYVNEMTGGSYSVYAEYKGEIEATFEVFDTAAVTESDGAYVWSSLRSISPTRAVTKTIPIAVGVEISVREKRIDDYEVSAVEIG